MNATLHDATNAGYQVGGRGNADDASRRADNVHHVIGAAAGANGVPVRIECAHRNRDTGFQPQFLRPEYRENTGKLIRGGVTPIQLFADSRQQRIDFDQEVFWGQPAELRVPHPLVTHSANTALHVLGVGNSTERGSDHVTVLESGYEFRPLGGVMAEPMEQFGESPL